MKRIFYSTIIALSLIFSHSAFSEAAKPELLVVKFHADWCDSCRVLGPTIDKARGKAGLDDMPVLFVTLDLTDATKRNQASLLASSIGLGSYFEKNAGKTGFAILVDADSGKVKGKLTKDMDANAMIKSIKSYI